jgi:hypothetical protein
MEQILRIKRPHQPRLFNKLTRSRFARERMKALAAHLGRQPTYTEHIIIQRIISIERDLRRQDAKLERGEELSAHALHARLAAENRLRLDLRYLDRVPRVSCLGDLPCPRISSTRRPRAALATSG